MSSGFFLRHFSYEILKEGLFNRFPCQIAKEGAAFIGRCANLLINTSQPAPFISRQLLKVIQHLDVCLLHS
jgi:hypothetical protein